MSTSAQDAARLVPWTIADYERRRCAIFGARYPAFGFGPPLTRPGAELWACGPDRHELAARLARPTPAPAPDSAEAATDTPQRALL